MSPHVSVPEGQFPKVGADYAYMGPAATQVPEKGMNAYALAFLTGMVARFGMETIVAEVQ